MPQVIKTVAILWLSQIIELQLRVPEKLRPQRPMK